MVKRETGGGKELEGEKKKGDKIDFRASVERSRKKKENEAQQEVDKVERKKQSKVDRIDSTEKIGSYMVGLSKKEGKDEVELIFNHFNLLVFSEFGDEKVPKAVQSKLNSYNIAKNEYKEANETMENLPEEFQEEEELLDDLETLKSDVIAKAKELASELGVNYEEIASRETALLGSEDEEIAGLREELDKYSSANIDYKEESYEEYGQRVIGGIRDRMVTNFSDNLNYEIKPWGGKGELKTEDPKILEDNEKKEKAYETLMEIELEGLVVIVNESVEDETERKAIFEFLDKKFGGVIAQTTGGTNILLSCYQSDTLDKKLASQLTLQFAKAEAKLKVAKSILFGSGEYNQMYIGGQVTSELQFLSRIAGDMDLADKQIYEPWYPQGNDQSNKFLTVGYAKGVDTSTSSRFSDTTDMHVVLYNQVLKKRGLMNNKYNEHSVVSEKIEGFRSENSEEVKLLSNKFKEKFEKKLAGREPTNQDKVDLITTKEGGVEVKSLDDAKALIAVLGAKAERALGVAAEADNQLVDLKSSLEKARKETDDLKTRLEKELVGAKEKDIRISKLSNEKQELGLKNQQLETRNSASERSLESERADRLKEEEKIKKALKLIEEGSEEGLPGFGKKEEKARRQKILDALEK